MKKKIFAILLIAVMVLSSFSAVFAAENDGSITVANAAKGETYGLVKLFDATVAVDAQGKEILDTDGKPITNYTGTIPDALKDYLTKDSAGNIFKAEGKTDDEVAKKVAEWAKTQTPSVTKTAEGGPVVFDNLAYGYYAITSTQGEGNATVNSANKHAIVYDKNKSEITVEKEVAPGNASIGDKVTYTATFSTVNFIGEGEDAKQVIKYTVKDTLPEFLKNVTVKSIKVDEVALPTQQFAEKQIVIPWATGDATNGYTNLYKNGATLEVVYEAVLTDIVNINTANTNTVSLHPTTWTPDGGEEEPWDDSWQDDAVVKTYAAALKKTDGTKALAGAQFTIKGLTVTGSNGEYTVVSYNPANDAAESAVLDTDANGKLYIIGLAENVNLTVTEFKAPNGYNKLTAPVTVPVQLLSTEIYKTSGTIFYDAKGNVTSTQVKEEYNKTVEKNITDLDAQAIEVINRAGIEMPETGGMGTTILYLIGGALVIGAGVMLVTRKKMDE